MEVDNTLTQDIHNILENVPQEAMKNVHKMYKSIITLALKNFNRDYGGADLYIKQQFHIYLCTFYPTKKDE